MSINFIHRSPQPKKKAHHYFIPCAANDHRPHFIRHNALHFYSALLLGLKVFVLATLFLVMPGKAEFSTIASKMIIDLTNKARVEAGLPLLMESQTLNKSALLKAENMIKENYFAHNSPAGVNPWEWFKQAGYNYTYAGENLAMNFSEAEEAISAWLASPAHKANIMNGNYKEIGVSVAIGQIDGQQTTIVVQHFGKSYLGPTANIFGRSASTEVPAITGGTTLVSGGQSEEVLLVGGKPQNFTVGLIYYSKIFFAVIGIFVFINLLLTIFIRIKIQHKPVVIHALLVVILAGVLFLARFHFLENIAGEPLVILSSWL